MSMIWSPSSYRMDRLLVRYVQGVEIVRLSLIKMKRKYIRKIDRKYPVNEAHHNWKGGKSKMKGYGIILKRNRKYFVLKKYSIGEPVCICCGCNLLEYLTIDHIKGGNGIRDREIMKRNILGWLIKNNFPKGFQVLCTICNSSKNSSDECQYHKHIEKPKIFLSFRQRIKYNAKKHE